MRRTFRRQSISDLKTIDIQLAENNLEVIDHSESRHVNADVLSRKAWCECGELWSADLTVCVR